MDDEFDQHNENEEQKRKRKAAEAAKEAIRIQNEAFTNDVLLSFLKYFPPAETLEEAARFYTSDEIIDAIRKLFPTAIIDTFLLSVFLKEHKYSYTAISGSFNISFKWMIK
jgi:hypothetical protein